MDTQKRLHPTQQSGDLWPCPARLSSHGAEQEQKTHPGLPSARARGSSHTHPSTGAPASPGTGPGARLLQEHSCRWVVYPTRTDFHGTNAWFLCSKPSTGKCSQEQGPWDLALSPSYVAQVLVGGCYTPPESRNAYKMTAMKYLWMGSQDFFFFLLLHS